MKGKRILLIIVLVIFGGVLLYLRVRKSNDFEPQIKEKLAKLVSDASNKLYKLDLEHIEIDITAASVMARNIILIPDSLRMTELEKTQQLGNNIYYISLKQLDLTGLSPLQLLDEKNISLGKLVLDSPIINIIHKKRNFDQKDTGNLYDRIATKNQSYSIENLLLKNIQLTITDLDKNKKVSAFKNLSASFTDIKIDSSTKNDSTRFLFAKDAVIFMKGFSQVTAKNKYRFDIDSFALRPQDGSLQFFNLSLKPVGTKEEFNAKLSHAVDMYTISIKNGSVKNLNWFSLLSEDGFYGEEMSVSNGSIRIYHDRNLPDGPPKHDNFPHQQLMNIDFPVSVKKIILSNLFLSYEELNPKSQHTGTVEFYNANGEIENITNIAGEIGKNSTVTLKASAAFMNEAKLDAVLKFDLAKVKEGFFTVDAELGPMDGSKLNKITEGLALLKIKSVSVNKLKFHMAGTNTRGAGNVLFVYRDLSFDVLKNDAEEGELKKRGLYTFIANKFMIKKANPSKEAGIPKQYTAVHQHNPRRSFFNLIWKTLLEGILKTVK